MRLSLPRMTRPALNIDAWLARLPRVNGPGNSALNSGTLPFDPWLMLATITLMLTGFVMITSASMDVAAKDFGSAGFFILRQSCFMSRCDLNGKIDLMRYYDLGDASFA